MLNTYTLTLTLTFTDTITCVNIPHSHSYCSFRARVREGYFSVKNRSIVRGTGAQTILGRGVLTLVTSIGSAYRAGPDGI